ncbi:MAG: phosphatase PAP2 family protein [Bacteroidaceae bacterium]|nr:phosphatase PAP2 family protein [Bacteroidaceae bacterium]MDO4957132.1 phosphatase PAP2 family protein [Bacteroidales bacterium]
MDINSLIEFDQQLLLQLNGSDSIVMDNFMFAATKTLAWLPFFFALLYVVMKNNSMNKILLIVGLVGVAVFLAEGLSSGICKPYFHRFRPTQDPDLKGLVDMVNGYRGGVYSFFSSHASNTFSIAMFLSLIVNSTRFTITVFSWSVIHTYTRIYLGVHFPGDVLVGVIWGLIVGYLVYLLYRYIAKRWLGAGGFVSNMNTYSGYHYSSLNTLALILVLNTFGILMFSFFM